MTTNIELAGHKWTAYNDDSLGIQRGEIWEPHIRNLALALLKPGDVVLDVGAHIGWHSLMFADCVGPTGAVHCFEPLPDNLYLLFRNVFQNNLENRISIHALALSDREGKTTICNATFDNKQNRGDSFISRNPERTAEEDMATQDKIGKGGHLCDLNKRRATVARLDDLAIPGPIAFMKIDVQGTEAQVLRGAAETIKRDRPLMVIEVEAPCLAMFGDSPSDLFAFVRSLGYYIFYVEHEYPCDHLAVPIEKMNEFAKRYEQNIHPHRESNPLNNNVENGVTGKVVF
jgi:FkbM family methyltransferase